MDIQADEWLAGIFGYPVYRLTANADGATELEAHAAAQPGNAMYYTRVPTTDVALVQRLTDSGMRVVDTTVAFDRPGASGPAGIATPGVTVRQAQEQDYPGALRIAGSCFRYSRFHLDPLVPQVVAHRVKHDWILSYTQRKRGDALLIAVQDGEPLGFLAALCTDAGSTAVIDLVGVDAARQGRGAGKALVGGFVDRYGASSECLRVSTQAANIPSVRLYEQLGFRFAGSQYVLHMHVRDGRAAEG